MQIGQIALGLSNQPSVSLATCSGWGMSNFVYGEVRVLNLQSCQIKDIIKEDFLLPTGDFLPIHV